MRKQLLWLALCTGLGLSACATGPRPQVPKVPVDASKACASWRWIGISRLGAQCPDIPGWTVRPLFAQLAPVQEEPECPNDRPPDEEVPDPELIRELNRFCVYEIAGGKKSLKNLPFPPTASTELVRIDQDCAALSLSERYLKAKTWTPDSDFLTEAGKPTAPLEIGHPRGVRLAFLDTQPNGDDVPKQQGRSPHGYTLARIARALVCNSKTDEQEPYEHCAAQITTRLALPIVEFNANHPKNNRIDREWGGFLGMQSDLAAAIRDEVGSWLAERKEKSQRRLVLNLSLAWDGRLFGGLNEEQISDMRAGTQAIYQALRYARGYDVLVLAAAGNQKQDPCANFGPLLPAAWESGAPREKCCGKLDEKKLPLLYAVGGVHKDGSPLINSRPGGMPQRVAYGETDLFIGSSVATAVVSSIAAVVWNSDPTLTSSGVMNILDDIENKRLQAGATREGQPWKADFWFARDWVPGEAPPVRRLSLCTVLGQRCSEEAPAAPLLESQAADGHQGKLPEDSTKGSCQPWLLPQPESVPCPSCGPPPH